MAETLSTEPQPVDGAQAPEVFQDPALGYLPDGTRLILHEEMRQRSGGEQATSDQGEASPEDVAAREQDVAARYTDTELLGKSFRVRRAVQESGTQTIKAWEGMKAKIHNAIDTPGKAIRKFAFNRAKNSLARKQDRQQSARSARLYQRRQGAVDKAFDRLDRRGQSLNEHVGRMEARTRAVTEHEQQRRQEYIDTLKARKEKSLANKAVRARLHAEGASRRETRRIMAEIPAEHIGRVGKVAITTETSRRMISEAERLSHKTAKRQQRAETRTTRTEGRIDKLDEQVRLADETAVRINTDYLPFARGRVQTLGEKLDGLEEDNPERESIAAELQKAEADVVALESQLDYWRKTAEHNRRKSRKADERLGGLHGRQHELSTQAELVSGQEVSLRETHKTHRQQLGGEIRAALNPSEAGKGKES